MITIYALITGYILDLIFGDPEGIPHPVRYIGNMIAKGEKLLRQSSCQTDRSKYLSGIVLTVVVVAISFIIPYLILSFAGSFHPVLRYILETVMCYQILATKALKKESMRVFYDLEQEKLPEAKTSLSRIVGRDTENLNTAQVTKGAVETVAENVSDGIIAPMIFILIGGAPLGFLYKAINTLDSMIGYKNDKYLHFGRFAAKLDDLANYIPARISAYLMIISTGLLRYDVKGAIRTYKRDRYNHTSPNSAHTEAVCAGALNIQLAGENYYFGKLIMKPTIGDENREIEIDDIRRANNLLYVTSILGLILGVATRFLILEMYF